MKRLFALLLCLVMCLSLIPAAAAEDIEIIDADEGDVERDVEDEDLIAIIDSDRPEDPEAAVPAPEAEINAAPLIIDTGPCGEGLTWTLYEGGLLQISGSGTMTDYESKGAPWYSYRGQITSLVIEQKVRYIGAYAFYGCSEMAWSDLQGGYALSVNGIGDCAFLSCNKLDYIDLDFCVTSVGRQAFGYCEGLRRVTIRSSPSLGIHAFGGCTGLEEIGFLGGAPTFSSTTFSGCTATAWYPGDDSSWTSSVRQDYSGSITWKAGYHGWCGDDICWDFDPDTGMLSLSGGGETWDFDQTVYRSDGVEASLGTEPSFLNYYRKPDGTYLFDSILSVKVGEGVTRLGKRIFEHLENAESFSLPDTLLSIDSLVFAYCPALKIAYIPTSVTSIGYGIYSECSNLEEIRFLGHAPSSISDKAFMDVTATVYHYPLSFWSSVAGKSYGGTLTWVCEDKIGDDVTWFLYHSGTLEISGTGRTWDYISGYPGFFHLKDECTRLDVESGVTGLGDYLFFDMDQLTYAAFPETLTEIGRSAFSQSGLQEMVFTGDAPTFASNCFNGVTATATYPSDKAGWTANVLQNYGGAITWVPGVVKPTITTQPKSVSAAAGSTAKFTVAATGGGLSYQWQYRTSSTGEWKDSTASSAKTATLSITAESYRNGYQYRCKVSNSAGTTTSNAATLTVTSSSKPTITTQPKSVTAAAGSTAKFTVAATGATSYQWQWRSGSSGTWADCTSATTGYRSATLQVSATNARNGYQYRCKVSNSAGSVTSNTATLTVTSSSSKPTITTQPKSVSAAAGSTAKFTVAATGATGYQWQWRSGSSGTWADCTSATTGYHSATLQVSATTARNGYQYRCKVSNSAGSVTSNTATLTVTSSTSKPTITTQPKSVTAAAGSTAKFTVTATGATSYQWQWRSSSSGTWADCTSATTGYRSATLQVSATTARNGYQYRCKVTNSAGTTTSNTATLTVISKPTITTQPKSVIATANSTATFTVKATGGALTYQWYYRTSSTGAWNKCSNGTSATLSVEAKSYRSGYQYRCLVKNAAGEVYSNTVTLTVS